MIEDSAKKMTFIKILPDKVGNNRRKNDLFKSYTCFITGRLRIFFDQSYSSKSLHWEQKNSAFCLNPKSLNHFL